MNTHNTAVCMYFPFHILSLQLVESEIVADNCKSRCAEQQIPFYRFSPQLDEVVAAGETDNEKIINMVIQAKKQTKEQGLREVLQIFQMIAEAKVKHAYRETKKHKAVSRYSGLYDDTSQ